MKVCTLNFWWTFNFCKTQVQTKTSRVITQASGKQYLQRLLTRAEIFKMVSQRRPQIKVDAQSHPWVTRPGAFSNPPAVTELVWSSSAEVVVSTDLPGVLAKGIICGVTSLHVPSLARQWSLPKQHHLLRLLLPVWWESIWRGQTLQWVSEERGVWYCWYCYSACLLFPGLENFKPILTQKNGSFGAWFSPFNQSERLQKNLLLCPCQLYHHYWQRQKSCLLFSAETLHPGRWNKVHILPF